MSHTQSKPSAASERSWRAFQDRVADLGGTVLEPTWLGSKHRHRVRCAAGHESTAGPDWVRKGGGICRTCAGNDPAVAEKDFRARVAELGGTVLEPVWLGNNRPHRVRCTAGHENSPRPNSVRAGQGICQTCAGRDVAAAWLEFRARVAAMGGTVLEPRWLGSNHPHRARCALGHEITTRPSWRGKGICRTCAGKDPMAAEREFRARVEELGGTVLEPRWLGNNRPHRIRCASGHENAPHPSGVLQGRGICRTCAGRDPVAAWQAFRDRVDKLGGTVLELAWLGHDHPHRVRCAAGHNCAPQPRHVRQGQGLCLKCAGKAWDAFYVVTDDDEGRVKFGVSFDEATRRLGDHRRDGYSQLVRLLVHLPKDVAIALERSVKACLRLAQEKPVRGWEYFDISALPLILDVVDNFPIPGPAALAGAELTADEAT